MFDVVMFQREAMRERPARRRGVADSESGSSASAATSSDSDADNEPPPKKKTVAVAVVGSVSKLCSLFIVVLCVYVLPSLL